MGSNVWNPVWNIVEDRRCYGVAKYHFQPTETLKANYTIEINFGETVRIIAECQEWFLVRKKNDSSQNFKPTEEGILPKSYIHILECSVNRHGDTDVIIPKYPPVVQEITSVLREWHRLAKTLYLTHHEDLATVRGKIIVLHDCRRRIMYPNLTKDGLRELKKQVASVIDSGNHLLKLDMTVRDENGNPLNPSVTSTIELFRQHQKSAKKLKKQRMKNSQRKSQTVTHHSHSLLVNLEKISFRIVDTCEIRIFLYDANQNQPFSESAQCTMKMGESSSAKLPIKFLFTDLGKKDMERKKVYLVAYVVRIGAMEYKEPEVRRENTPFAQRSNSQQQVRRPWGVAARDITSVLKTYISEENQFLKHEKEEMIYVPYIPFGEYDCLETALHKLFSAKEASGKESRIGLFCMVSLISGTPAQIQEENPLLIRGNPTVARKMGFPEVILPNDVRNDLYVRLIKGEFHHRGAKTTDKNIECTVSAYDSEGRLLKGLIFGGEEYKSVVYYHDDKPKWYEIFKISLPISIDEFSSAHLKFTFKHRSSSETKDKQEKPFAISYVPLRNRDGTAVADGLHELFVYKLDPKHYKEGDLQYLNLLAQRQKPWEHVTKPQCPGFSLSNKDYFQVQTTLCSTKFTQNAQLLELLQWSTKLKNLAERNSSNYLTAQKSQEEQVETLLNELKQVIVKVLGVSGDEIVKFLPDVFDALFLILVDPIESIQSELGTMQEPLVIDKVCDDGTLLIETCDRPVFECLIYIFGLILDHKYQNFKSVLSLYILDGFSSALAYRKLIKELQYYIERADDIMQLNQVLKIMKSIEYFFKFIIRSYNIRSSLRSLAYQSIGHDGCDDETEFERSIEKLFGAMSRLLRKKDGQYLTAQGGCLKHIPSVIEHLCAVFSARKLSELLFEIIVWVPAGKLTKQKLTTIRDIVHSPLFLDPACRTMLLPIVAQNIQNHLPGNDEDLRRRSLDTATSQSRQKIGKIFGPEVNEGHPPKIIPGIPSHSEETEKCVELLSDVMNILFREDIGPTEPDVSYLMQILLRPIILSIGTIGENDQLAGDMVAILLSLFRQMNNRHYSILIKGLKGDPNSQELRKFINDVLVVKKNLFAKPYFPLDWSEMILLQNSIVVTTLDHFSATIRAEYADPFEEQPWNNFFQSAVSFLTQKSLQLENFAASKRMMTAERYGDMRKKAGELIRAMWFSLGVSKRITFVPMMVGTFLDMTLVPEPELRRSTIPIFFDMMHCEFDGTGSFKMVEDELTKRLVEFVESGKGDRSFREIFYETMSLMCENDNSGLRVPGLSMVHTMARLLDLLLEYREVHDEDDPSNRMTCIVNLLDFSKEIDRKDLYLRYLYKLHDLHKLSNNYTEAAFTLKLHSRQLDWTEDEIPQHLQSPRYPNFTTQFELKEALYNDIVKYLINGKMWECALEVSDELRQQYAEESFNYIQLPQLLRQMSTFYEEIMKKVRVTPTYFRVAFYGRAFPSFLQDKSHIYRGKEYEQLSDFQNRMLERYPQAELLGFLTYPSEELRNSNKQLLQICKVDPIMGTSNNKRMSAMKNADECVRVYYKTNEIDKFTYSRPYHREPRDSDQNEFSTLWLDRYTLWTSQSFPGIMSWFPVVRETSTQIRPIVHAIEELENTNQVMRDLIITHWASPNENIGPLSMKLNGILDAAVMGGIANYEKAFLTTSYLEKHPDDFHYTEKLKNVICSQVPILEQGLKIHEQKAGEILMPLHRKIEQCFQNFVAHVENEYSVKCSDLKDATLMREIGRAQKKRQLQINKEEVAFRDQLLAPRFSDGGLRENSRSKGSFSSTMSLYSNTPKVSGSKSMHSISRYDTMRRSTQGSVSEIPEFTMGHAVSSATLPRNGLSFGASSANSLHSLNVNVSETEAVNNKAKDTATLIPLTQTLTSQRPLRAQAEQRRSQILSSGNGNRYSGISVNSLSNNTPESSSRNSMNLADVEDDDITAPPLPPKQREGKPPTPPPKKPPLRQPF